MKVGKEMRITRRDRAAQAVRRGMRPQGFTLVEIMVGLMVLLIAMAGLVPLFLAGFENSSAVRYKSTASNIAREKMESIRQLDYRDIPADTDDEGTVTNDGKVYLTNKFGGTEDVRGVSYTIDYGVEKIGYGTGALKEVSVEVYWTAPPNVTPVKLTTMFHQQYNGLRISRMEVHSPEPIDVLDDPFDRLGKDSTPWLYVFLAEDDWDLAVDNLNEATMSAKPGVYMKYDVVDEVGASTLDAATREAKIYDLDWDDSTGPVTDVFFKVQLNVAEIPDGYWDFNALAFNQYEEPGNKWTLRLRVENGGPDAPSALTAVGQADNESVILNWEPPPDTDRDYYVIQRSKNLSEGVGSGVWETIAGGLDPDSLTYTDVGDIDTMTNPWGTESQPNWYRYRIWVVDLEGIAGAICDISVENAAELPPGAVAPTTTLWTTTTVSGPTTTVVTYYTITVESQVNKKWLVTITCDNPAQSSPFSMDVDGIVSVSKSGLRAGNYHALATSPGKPDVEKDFTLGPLYDPGTPVLLLN